MGILWARKPIFFPSLFKKNIYFNLCIYLGASLVAQTVKSLPEMQETQVRSLHWEDPLEKDMASRLVVPGLSCGTQAA